MQNQAMPEGRDYVVVTRVTGRRGRVLVHVYGPYSQIKAKSVKGNIKKDHDVDAGDLEVSVCHVLDPESWKAPGPAQK